MEAVGSTSERFFSEGDLPVKVGLKVIRTNDPDFGLSDDEIQERNEFISWYVLRDSADLRTLPEPERCDFFFISNLAPEDEGYSAYNTIDFQRRLPAFDKYGYAIRKIMERVKDLAILHSVINSTEGRQDVYEKYMALVEGKFRSRLKTLIGKYQTGDSWESKDSLKIKIAEVNQKILQCQEIWETHSPYDI